MVQKIIPEKREILKYFKCHIFHYKFTVILLQQCFSNNKTRMHLPRRNLAEYVTVLSYRYWFPTSIIVLVTKFDKLQFCPETVVFDWQIMFSIQENIFSKITLFQKSDNRKRVYCRTHSSSKLKYVYTANNNKRKLYTDKNSSTSYLAEPQDDNKASSTLYRIPDNCFIQKCS